MAHVRAETMKTYELELSPATPLEPIVVPGTPAFELAVVHAARSWLSHDDTVLNVRGLALADTVSGPLCGLVERSVNFEANLVSGESRAWGSARFVLDDIGEMNSQWAGTLAEGAMWGHHGNIRHIAAYTMAPGGSVPVGPIRLSLSLASGHR